MASDLSVVELANGVKVPVFGFGTAFGDWTSEKKGTAAFTPEDAWSAVPKALNAGIRHFDTAYVYRTHRHIGTTLGMRFADGSLKRSDVFITTKVCHGPNPMLLGKTLNVLDSGPPWESSGFGVADRVRSDILASLDELGLGYVDLLLVHWPGMFDSKDKAVNRKIRKAIWTVFEEIYERGGARAIGVSNFNEEHIADLLADGAEITPHVNQIEMSPHTQYTSILDYCKGQNIKIEAYSPLGSSAGGVLKDPLLVNLAAKYKKNVGQLVLRWMVQQGVIVLPRSSSESRIKSNMDIFDFEISSDDMTAIGGLNKGKSLTNASPYEIA